MLSQKQTLSQDACQSLKYQVNHLFLVFAVQKITLKILGRFVFKITEAKNSGI